jgi:hypothetical protein
MKNKIDQVMNAERWGLLAVREGKEPWKGLGLLPPRKTVGSILSRAYKDLLISNV